MVRSRGVCFLVVIGLFSLAVLAGERGPIKAYAQTSASVTNDTGVKRTGYVGDAACLSCHKEQSLSYRHSSHHLTSQPADKDSILGTFTEGSNILMISNPEKA